MPETLRRSLSRHLRTGAVRVHLSRGHYLARGDLRAQLRQLIRMARKLRLLSRRRRGGRGC